MSTEGNAGIETGSNASANAQANAAAQTCPNCGADYQGTSPLCPECVAETAAPTTSFAPVAPPVAAAVDAPAPSVTDICLCVVKGPQIGECFYLEGDEVTIGRDPAAQLFLNDRTVSREHARIVREPGRVMLYDAGSLNGSYVNGVIVDATELHEGDVIQIGTFQMAFHTAGSHSARPAPAV
ncbi:MAG: FHA domain-containing protein [Actinomycetes bacterium]|jgi:hypothetical protein|nr:FHA domain-containing protein [Actinomycetes bacterium]